MDLWKETADGKPIKYASIGSLECFGGMLHKVERKTPRSIETYVYIPFTPNQYMTKKDSNYDYHICLDHLWSLDPYQYELLRVPSYRYKPVDKEYIPVEKLKSERGKYSHIITVIKSSRWLNKEGDYVGEVLFQQKVDLVGSYKYFGRDRKAIPMFRKLVSRLRTISPVGLDWKTEISKLQKELIK